MNKKRGIRVLLMFIIISMFLSIGCQDNSDRANDEPKEGDGGVASDESRGLISEEELADLKVELVEGQDYYKALNIDAKEFELEDLDGNKVKLSDYRGKVVFLNFWATWCPPCKAEMPYMQEIHEKYEDVAILAINSTSTELKGGRDSKKAKKQVAKFIDKEGYTFPIVLDADDEISMTYNSIFPLIGIPTTFVIDKDGIIRCVTGMFSSKAHIEQFIKLAHE